MSTKTQTKKESEKLLDFIVSNKDSRPKFTLKAWGTIPTLEEVLRK